jgi:tRNA(fMet)-specific endonuclease VapC
MLDTNICIYLIKRQPPEVFARFEQCLAGDIVMSAITLAELRYGVECSGQRRAQNDHALKALIEDIPAIAFAGDEAYAYGILRSAVRDRKRDALDQLIAAHAISLNLTLVTNNESDFVHFPKLRVENWVTPQ